MNTTDTNTLSQVEVFLAGDDGGLRRKWALAGCQRSLKAVATANGLILGEARQRSPGCLEFKLHFPRQRLPRWQPKLRMTLPELFRQTGCHVPGRARWRRGGARQRSVVTVSCLAKASS